MRFRLTLHLYRQLSGIYANFISAVAVYGRSGLKQRQSDQNPLGEFKFKIVEVGFLLPLFSRAIKPTAINDRLHGSV